MHAFRRGILLLLITWSGALPQEGAPAPTPGIDDLLAALSQPDFEARRKATELLLARGRAIVPELKAARSRLSLEARIRVDQILERILARGPGRKPSFQPTRITIHCDERPLEEVLKRLEAVAGAPLVPPARDGNESQALNLVTLHVEDRPFFEALDAFCKAAGLEWRRDPRSGAFTFRTGTGGTTPVIYNGPFRIQIRTFSITRQLVYTGDLHVSAYIQVIVDMEAGAPVLGILSPLVPTAVLDDKGRSLVPDVVPTNAYMVQTTPRRQFNLTMTIAPPARDAKKIKTLECTLRAVVATENSEGVLRAPFEPGRSTEDPGGLPLTLISRGRENDRLRIEFSYPVQMPEGDLPPNIRINFSDHLTLLDGSGARISPLSTGRRRTRDKVTITLVLPQEDLAEIRVEVPSAFETREIPLRFENVPIP